MQKSVGDLAYYLSIVSFILFALEVVVGLVARLMQGNALPNKSPVGGGAAPGNVPDTLNAFAKLVDSLNKSSPALLSLLASFAFLALSLASTSSFLNKS